MKKDYMTRLERAARWRLPRQEAEDVIADYCDIVGAPPRSEEELLRDLGRPADVVRQLTCVKAYRIWLAAFFIMTACILIPGLSILGIFPSLIRICFAVDTWGWIPLMHFGPVLAFLGMAGALVWFRRNGQRKGPLPAAIAILLAALGLWIASLLLVDWCWMSDPQGFSDLCGWTRTTFFGIPFGPEDNLVPRSLELLQIFTQYGGLFTALLGVFALIKARTGDRRWAAVYVLTAAAMLVSIETFALLCNLGLEPEALLAVRWSYLGYYIAVAALGLVGTGVALC